jgi:hypothetical protein
MPKMSKRLKLLKLAQEDYNRNQDGSVSQQEAEIFSKVEEFLKGYTNSCRNQFADSRKVMCSMKNQECDFCIF